MECSTCGKETKNPKFCSRSCAAKTTNATKAKRERQGKCFTCKAIIKAKNKYCDKCYELYLSNRKDNAVCTICKCPKNENTTRQQGGTRKGYQAYCRKCMAGVLIVYSRKIKQQAVDYKGGKCIRCGYNKCTAALDFHHRNPHEKDFTISTMSNRKFDDELRKELDKCDCLCSNCHREQHIVEKDEEYKDFIILFEVHQKSKQD